MHREFLFAAAFAAALALFSINGISTASAGERNERPAIFDNGMCWNVDKILLKFNADLDPALENPNGLMPPHPSAGDAKLRRRAFDAAVDDWNQALAAVSSKKRLISRHIARPWAAEQGRNECIDAGAQTPVLGQNYGRTSPDRHNTGSTAAATITKFPGWIVGKQIVESYAVCDRLAETKLIPPPTDRTAKHIDEADVLYFTHVHSGPNRCAPIQWDYRFAPAPAPAPFQDFYSVMLHEIGHVLGLDHMDCPVRGGRMQSNVMTAMLPAGDRTGIQRCELAGLALLYGVGGRCED